MKLLIKEKSAVVYMCVEILDSITRNKIRMMHEKGNFNQLKKLALSKGNLHGMINTIEAADVGAELIISGTNLHTDLTLSNFQ